MKQKQQIKRFVERWKALPCVEEEHSRSFWIEFAEQVLGIPQATKFLEFERKVKGRKIDVLYEDMGILIEQKSRGVSLDEATVRSKRVGPETPFQQAKWYADNLPYSVRPRWIITCNFDEFRIYDMDKENCEDYICVSLEELPDQAHLFSFFADKSNSRLVKEKELSVQAGKIVGDLYKAFEGQYRNIDTDPQEQKSLNVLIVRLVFLLYAEDAGLLHKHNAFGDYLQQFKASQMRQALIDLFKVLDTPDGKNGTKDERDPYLDESLVAFPYVNGGLFAGGGVVIPQFTEQMRCDLVDNASISFDWKDISPTIFGAVFESTLNPDTRRKGGMHYTSIENIHKVIDPLFLDGLKAELAGIEGEKVEKNRKMKLRVFQRKLASINILDPACGSGNFLTESYLSLRKLENRVLENLQGDQMALGFDNATSPIQVGIRQFYGIELNDFAVSVARTALWIAEEQMMEATQEILQQPFNFLPLKSNGNICEGNALRMDWNEVIPAESCSFICGNPPFLGYSNLSASQKEDRAAIFGKSGGTLDYVSCWYRKAADYSACTHLRSAFVSTNSICQGQQVEPLWKPLFDDGICINFAYQTFVWNSEAIDEAHVHVVIVGFSREKDDFCRLFSKEGENKVGHINGYLSAAPDAFLKRRGKPICSAPEMAAGGKPTDGGNLLLSSVEYEDLVANEPSSAKWIRPFSMGAEFIKGQARYCLWLDGASSHEIEEMPLVKLRVDAVREFRLSSKKVATQKKAATPWLFDEVRPPKGDSYIAVPKVSSGRRVYVPMGFVRNGMIPGDKLFFVSNAGLFEFGVLESQFHNAWMRLVAGRLKSDYSYSNTIVYNNFVWPNPDSGQRVAIETCAQRVLDVREGHPEKSLADLYDPDKMPSDLLAAHKALDAAVEAAYGVDFNGDEEQIVAHLFALYSEIAGEA